MRLSLARALVMLPDIMLLDEPTNHLDFKAVVWLEYYLQGWKKSLVVVTHDKDFIDNVATDILTIVDKRLLHCRGSYDDLVHTLTMSRTKQSYKPHFDFGDCPYDLPDSAAINVSNLTFSYVAGEVILKDIDMCLHNKSRIAVLGGNGTGKSTLLKIICGCLRPGSGLVQKHNKLRLSYYGQHVVDDLETESTPVQYISGRHSNANLTSVHKTLSLFGLAKEDRIRSMSKLSGGQRSRVIFADIYLQKPHLVILDEPTNHLDTLSIDALSTAIAKFEGGVVVASHNSQLLNAVTEDEDRSEVWFLENGEVYIEPGGFQKYKKDIMTLFE